MKIVGTNIEKKCDLVKGYSLYTWTNLRGVKYCGVITPEGHVGQSLTADRIDEVEDEFWKRIQMGIY